MPQILLTDFMLSMDIGEFLETFWLDSEWYERFMVERLCDLSVSIGGWQCNADENDPSSASLGVCRRNAEGVYLVKRSRNVKSYHPSKISFPGLPSHAESLKVQTLECQFHDPQTPQPQPVSNIPTTTNASNSNSNISNPNSTGAGGASNSSSSGGSNMIIKPLINSGGNLGGGSASGEDVKSSNGTVSSWGIDATKSFRAVIKEINSFRGIPYADYFNVVTEWRVEAIPGIPAPDGSKRAPSCAVTIYLDFQFLKSTWLQGTIEANTKAELLGVYELWQESANEYIRYSVDERLRMQLQRAPSMEEIASGVLLDADDDIADDGDGSGCSGRLYRDGELRGEGEGESGARMVGEGDYDAEGDGEMFTGRSYDSADSLQRSGGGAVVATSLSRASSHAGLSTIAPTGREQHQQQYGADFNSYPSDDDLQFFDCEEGGGGGGGSGRGRGATDGSLSPIPYSLRRNSAFQLYPAARRPMNAGESSGQREDEDLEYGGGSSSNYTAGDIEESAEQWSRRRGRRRSSASSRRSSRHQPYFNYQYQYQYRAPPPTPPELHHFYGYDNDQTVDGLGDLQRFSSLVNPAASTDGNSSVVSTSAGGNSSESEDGGGLGPESGLLPKRRGVGGLRTVSQHSTHDMAVNLVETIFVLAEFFYWRVYTMYVYDMRDLMNIETSRVLSRVLNSFMPGWHSPLLIKPDLYGPCIAVLMLPQSLLISMEIPTYGCNPTSQMRNAVVMTLLIWFGLSVFYRLLSYVVAPSISFKHCLSVTGYSFYPWNLALLLSYPLELYSETLHVPVTLPLILLGIPCAIAQGAMFWEHTAASSMTLQPSVLPTSMQHFATNNSRCLQKLLWALPKIAAFVVVAGTHYQFLWYIARVFLPGRRQMCRLSALIQPSQYTDILTQKELRKFALALMRGKPGSVF